MRTLRTLLLIVAAGALMTLGVAAPAQAAGPTFKVSDGGAWEYHRTCADVAPFACGDRTQTMYMQVVGPWPPRSYPITLGYVIEPITATAGVDYTGTTGTVTIPAGQYVASIPIPVVNDRVAEPNETLRVRLTSSSVGGNISDTGIGTIFNDGAIPADCTLFKPDLATTTMTCTGRPAGQTWRHVVDCFDTHSWGMLREYGPVVAGNGSSTTVCTDNVGYLGSAFQVIT